MQGGQFFGIKQLGGLWVVLVQFAHFAPRATNFGAGGFQHLFIRGVFPQNKIFNDFEQPLPLNGGFFLVLSVFETATLLIAWVIDELSKDDCPRRCERTPRPPQMQRGRMPMPDGFLSRRCGINCIERESTSISLRGDLMG